jgi:hypothetical protein
LKRLSSTQSDSFDRQDYLPQSPRSVISSSSPFLLHRHAKLPLPLLLSPFHHLHRTRRPHFTRTTELRSSLSPFEPLFSTPTSRRLTPRNAFTRFSTPSTPVQPPTLSSDKQREWLSKRTRPGAPHLAFFLSFLFVDLLPCRLTDYSGLNQPSGYTDLQDHGLIGNMCVEAFSPSFP